MAVQRLVLDSIAEDSYELIAIHSAIASHRIAFLINKYTGLQLYRAKEDVSIAKRERQFDFPLYRYKDIFEYRMYYLLVNSLEISEPEVSRAYEGLFQNNLIVKDYLIPEMKKVDYFLKIEMETDRTSANSFLSKLLSIPQILTAYLVESNQLKSKNLLIFE